MELSNRGWLTSSLLAIGLLASLTVARTAAAEEERVFDKKFAVAAGGTLKLNTDIGAVAITGSEGSEVVIHATISGDRRYVEDFEIEADSTSDGVTVSGRRSIDNWFDFSWTHNALSVRYTIQVPRNYHVNVRNSRGNLDLRNFNGKAYAHTSRGNVEVTGINGEVQIDTSRGNVHGSQLTGNVSLVTSRGQVTLDKVTGAINVESSRGNVEVELSGPNRGAAVKTSRGNVLVRIPAQFAADLVARTTRGDVECNLPLASIEHSSGKRHEELNGTLNGGGKLVTLETSRGDIEIRASL